MEKITRLNWQITGQNIMDEKDERQRHEKAELLQFTVEAVFKPFGSLTSREQESLPQVIADYIGDNTDGKWDQIVRLLKETDDMESELGWTRRGEVWLRTPSSATIIHIDRSGVEVDFGWEGSNSRAWDIMSNAYRRGIMFVAAKRTGVVSKGEILRNFLSNKINWLEWCKDLTRCTLQENDRKELVGSYTKEIERLIQEPELL